MEETRKHVHSRKLTIENYERGVSPPLYKPTGVVESQLLPISPMSALARCYLCVLGTSVDFIVEPFGNW